MSRQSPLKFQAESSALLIGVLKASRRSYVDFQLELCGLPDEVFRGSLLVFHLKSSGLSDEVLWASIRSVLSVLWASRWSLLGF